MALRKTRAAAVAAVLLVASQALAQRTPTDTLTPPRVVKQVDAIYPPEAMAESLAGQVVLFVTVGADGTVMEIAIAESAGRVLDHAAKSAMLQWQFEPAMRGRQAVAARIRVPFRFSPPTDTDAELPGAPSASSSAVPTKPPPESEGVEAPGIAGGVVISHEDLHRVKHGDDHHDHHERAAEAGQGASPTEVKVIGRQQVSLRGASDFRIRLGALRDVPRASATEMLSLAPGILLTNEGGVGHAEQVFLRGFDAREGQDIEFSVQGVPVNEAGNLHGHGHSNLSFVIPELVHGIRVLEGPFDPRQGNFSVAGSADYELGLERRGSTIKYARGSYGTERLLLLWGPQGESLGTFGGAQIYRTDGFGANRDARNGSAIGQYEGAIGERGSYRVGAQGYAATYHSAGVLRADDVAAGRQEFFGSYDPRQGGDSSRFSVWGDVEQRGETSTFRTQVFLVQSAMRLRENFTGFLLDTQQPSQNPHPQRGDGIDLSVESWTLGSRGSSRLKGKALGYTQEAELGYFVRGDTGRGTQLRTQASNAVPYSRETDLEYKLGDIGLYGDADLQALSWLRFRGGVRADLLTYDVQDLCAATSVRQPSRSNPPGDASCLSQQDFGRYREPTQRSTAANAAIMPRATMLVGPFRGFTLSASYGKGVRSIDPVYISQDTLTPFAKIAAYEGGVGYAGGTGDVQIVARSVFFRTNVERDILFDESAGRNTLSNGTTRTGWLGAVRLTGPWFDQSANVTVVRSKFDDTGLLIPYVPDFVLRSDSSAFATLPKTLGGHAPRGTVSAGVTYVGRRALPYGQRSDVLFSIDASAKVAWRMFEAGMDVTNLLDRRYRLGEYNYASDFRSQEQPTLVPMRHFSAGPPRMFMFTLGLTFGGEP